MIELARDASLSRDLAAGGVFVPGCALRMSEECELVVCGSNRRVSLPARVVYVDEQRGAGLELIGFSTQMRDQLAELAQTAETTQTAIDDDLALPTDCHIELSGDLDPEPTAASAFELGDDDLAVPVAHDDDPRTVPVRTADDGSAVPLYQDDDTHRTVPVAAAQQAAVLLDVAHIDDEFAAGDAAAGLDNDFGDADGAVPMLAGDAAAELDDEFADLDAPVPIGPRDAAAFSNDFDDDLVIMPAGSAGPGRDLAGAISPHDAAALGNDFIDDDAPGEGGALGSAIPPDDSATRLANPRAPRNVHERLRGLPLATQLKLATSGELHERIVLERLYGKNVWETLLRNPRLTAPEVSRIARYGSLPRILLELILANNAWLQVPEVRRALLSNPRLGTDQIMKVLRLTPKHELRLAALQTAYPHAVRNAAKQLLRDS